jgi:CNT family concentrative nucleoside transporter
MGRFTGMLGLLTMLALAFAFSTNRRAIRIKTVAWGLGFQFALALFVLRVRSGVWLLQKAANGATTLLAFSYEGSSFVFGELGRQHSSLGLIFAFQVLPIIIFIAAFFAVLYHLGVMQLIIRGGAWIMTTVMGASGAESLNLAASIFMGQTEAPLTIRPFLPELTQSELMCVMTSGMAHISGAMLAAYVLVGHADPRNLLTAVMEKEANILGAIARGTIDGLHLALNVGAMLIAFLALLALVNATMGFTHTHIGWFPYNLQQVLGWIFAPVAWLIGVPWRDAAHIGGLLGTRMTINEFVAFSQLGDMKSTLDPRTFTIATFALCGFANFSSIGIQIGGIGALAPNRRGDLARLGLRAMLAGTMANLMSASIAGMLI